MLTVVSLITGSKWITNKWIRWYPQVLNFPCDAEGVASNAPLSNKLTEFLTNGSAKLDKIPMSLKDIEESATKEVLDD